MISAIVLAAGRSTRLPPQKLLLEVGGKPVICCVVDELLASDVDEVCVVVGRDKELIRAALAGRAVRFVENPEPESEMLVSVRYGLRAIDPDCRAVLVALGDQPKLFRDVVNELLAVFRRRQRGIVVPMFESRRGHPLLISTGYREEILTYYDDVGLRGLLRAHESDVLELATSYRSVLEDMDTPDDYQRIRSEVREE